MTPQLIISLSPQGELVAELPGLNGARRKINLNANKQSNSAISFASQTLRDISNLQANTTGITDATKASELLNLLQNKMQTCSDAANQISNLEDQDNTVCDILLRILQGQLNSKSKLGEDGAPTAQQLRHWEKHSGIWGDPSCPFCISEGKFEKGKNRERSVKGLSEYEALRCGLISRGYAESKTKSGLWTKQNMGNIYLLPNGKVQDSKRVQWLDTHRTALIQDGKIHAKQFGFTPVPKPIKHQGTQVKKLVKMVKTTNQERIVKKLGNIIL
jgi:hypothetical protein